MAILTQPVAGVDDAQHAGSAADGFDPELLKALPRFDGARRIAELALRSLDADKAFDLMVIDLGDADGAFADGLVIASGRSDRHVGACAAHLMDKLKQAGVKGISIEGDTTCDWVLIDTGDVVIHLFRPEVRSFYKLEKLWGLETPEPAAAQAAFYFDHDAASAGRLNA